MLSGRGARIYTAHKGWLGVVMGISAASTVGVLVSSNVAESIDVKTFTTLIHNTFLRF